MKPRTVYRHIISLPFQQLRFGILPEKVETAFRWSDPETPDDSIERLKWFNWLDWFALIYSQLGFQRIPKRGSTGYVCINYCKALFHTADWNYSDYKSDLYISHMHVNTFLWNMGTVYNQITQYVEQEYQEIFYQLKHEPK